MTHKNLSITADRIAAVFYPNRFVNWERLRDHVDFATGSELDCTQLDILTDLVKARIANREEA
jgi:hypothetical protein